VLIPAIEHSNAFGTIDVRYASFEQRLERGTQKPVMAGLHGLRTRGLPVLPRIYVTYDNCRAGYGKVVATDLGGQYFREDEFLLRGGNGNSILADLLLR
jgi:hypothetical protein